MAALRGRALVAYLLVCTVWGSTYLAIRVGVGHLPPFLFAGVRFLTAGLLLGAITRAIGHRLPVRSQDWRTLAVTGVCLLVGGNAMVVWAEQYVASGTASLFVAVAPLWTAFIDASVPGGRTTLTWRIGLGLAVGFLGSALLAGVTPHELAQADLRGPVALVLGSAAWATGSVYWKRHPTEVSLYVAAAVQMLIAGSVLTLFGLALGEGAAWHLDRTGAASLAYLIAFGSIVAYTAYGYALKHASATVVGTYAYVNPVVAVLLGWFLLGEPVSARMVASMALILGAVLLIQLASRRVPAPMTDSGAMRALQPRRPAA